MRSEYLRISNGKKIEKGVEILRDFWATAYEGEISEIVCSRIREIEYIGKLLSGFETFTSGNVYLKGKRLDDENFKKSMGASVMSVFECPEFINELSVADNFISVSERNFPVFVKEKQNKAVLNIYLEKFGVTINPDSAVDELNYKQLFELKLLKLHYDGVKAVLLNLNTYGLTASEIEDIVSLLNRLKKLGMTFIIVTNKPLPIHVGVDRVTVVSDGITIMEKDGDRLKDIDFISKSMGERRASSEFVGAQDEARCIFEIKNLTGTQIKIENLKLKRGEVAAVYSRFSEQQSELLGLLSGSCEASGGAIWLENKRLNQLNRKKRISEGLLCAENRVSDNFLFEKMSVLDNYAFIKGMKNKRVWWNFRHRRLLKSELEREFGKGAADKKPGELSLYNQQKLKYMSYMLQRPKVLICLDPFSSVDIETGNMTEEIIAKMAKMGTAVLLLLGNYWRTDIPGVRQYFIDSYGTLHERKEDF